MTLLALLFFAQDYNAQALEYVRQARDTANPVYHAKAEEALANSFEAAPDNFDGLKAKTWLLLGSIASPKRSNSRRNSTRKLLMTCSSMAFSSMPMSS